MWRRMEKLWKEKNCGGKKIVDDGKIVENKFVQNGKIVKTKNCGRQNCGGEKLLRRKFSQE